MDYATRLDIIRAVESLPSAGLGLFWQAHPRQNGRQRAGRIQSAERAVPTRLSPECGYEPSFSLIRADSRHSAKGDSYV